MLGCVRPGFRRDAEVEGGDRGNESGKDGVSRRTTRSSCDLCKE